MSPLLFLRISAVDWPFQRWVPELDPLALLFSLVQSYGNTAVAYIINLASGTVTRSIPIEFVFRRKHCDSESIASFYGST